jgi:regulator of sirC expression with transglutaminase-like and TPR domain
MNRDEARTRFAEIISRDDQRIELDYAALLIATEEYPHLEIAKYLDHLDSFADQAREVDKQNVEPVERIMQLSYLLTDKLGFHGNRENYLDPRNSFLNDVIDRRTGIPITLSVIFIEVARRIGLKLSGVGMPAHFIVKYAGDDTEIFIDPFNGGRMISEDGCRGLVEQIYDGAIQFHPSFLASVTKKQILTRMLHNLKAIYARARDNHKTLNVIERLLLINPDAISETRDRGLIYSAMERYAQAQEDLEEYLRRAPNAEDANEMKEMVRKLRLKQAQFN